MFSLTFLPIHCSHPSPEYPLYVYYLVVIPCISFALQIPTHLLRDTTISHIFDLSYFRPIHNTIQPDQKSRRKRHQESRASKQPAAKSAHLSQTTSCPISPYPLRCIQHLKDRIRVEVVELKTPLNPEPVPKRDASAQRQGRQEGDGVWRREEEEVDDEGQRGDRVE